MPQSLSIPLSIWIQKGRAEKTLVASLAALANVPPGVQRAWDVRIKVDGELRAGLLQSICASETVTDLLGGRRLVIAGAQVADELDLSFLHVRFPVKFEVCTFAQPMRLNHARFTHLTISGGTLRSVDANGIIVSGDLDLGTRIIGKLSLQRARIRGSLRLNDSRLMNPGSVALDAANVDVGGAVEMKRLLAAGEVVLNNGRVRGDLSCNGARFINREEQAFTADLLRVGGDVSMREAVVRGETVLMNAECRGDLLFVEADLENPAADALSLDQVCVRGSIFLRGLQVRGSVRLPGAQIGTDLDCRCACIRGPERAEQQDFRVAKREPQCKCDVPPASSPPEVHPDDPPALVASRVRLQGNLYLNHFHSTGPVLLVGAGIGGSIIAKHAEISVHAPSAPPTGKGKTVIDGEAMTVHGSVSLEDVGINAMLDFNSARIGRNFHVHALRLAPAAVTGLLLENGHVQGELAWTGTRAGADTRMDLSHARMGRVRHGHESWPTKGRLRLTGCIYGAVGFDEEGPPASVRRPTWQRLLRLVWGGFANPSSAESWLGMQGSSPFDAQPYEQLSRVRRRSGDEEEAKQIEIAGERGRTRSGTDDFASVLVGRGNDVLLEYGHSTRRVWVLSMLLVLAGALLFGQAKRAGVMTASQADVYLDSAYAQSGEPREYPTFNALVYSMDSFLPIIDLHQEAYWLPNARIGCRTDRLDIRVPHCGGYVRWYLWAHVVIGWLATTLLVFSITGVMRYKPAV
jgi:hypothetical protein